MALPESTMLAAPAPISAMPLSRLGIIAVGVAALHLLALWWGYHNLQESQPQPLAALLPMTVKLIAPPAPLPMALPAQAPAPSPPKKTKPPQPAAQPVARQPARQPAPQPAAQSAPELTSEPALQAAPANPSPAPRTDGPAAAEPAPSAPAATGQSTAAPVIVPPSSDAQYLNNPKPPYPPLSRRLGESGRVIVHVLIGADGLAHDARLQHSSGYDRLDNAALQAVSHWRYRPQTRDGVPQTVWFDVPVDFVLE